MEIKTKYEHGDSLWYMEDNKPKSGMFTELKIECTYQGYADGGWGKGRSYPIKIYYAQGYSNAEKTNWKEEKFLFKTKEELISSL